MGDCLDGALLADAARRRPWTAGARPRLCASRRAASSSVSGDEAHAIARLELSHLPALGARDRDRADEAAEARPVRTEDDGHVARVVDRSDRVSVVVDVRRVKARLSAVAPRPARRGTDETDAGAVRVVVDLPRRVVESGDVVLGEEVRRSVGPVEDADLPDLRVRGQGDFPPSAERSSPRPSRPRRRRASRPARWPLRPGARPPTGARGPRARRSDRA